MTKPVPETAAARRPPRLCTALPRVAPDADGLNLTSTVCGSWARALPESRKGLGRCFTMGVAAPMTDGFGSAVAARENEMAVTGATSANVRTAAKRRRRIMEEPL